MQDQALVGVLDRQADLPEQLQPFNAATPAFGQIAQQRLAFDVFHDEVGRAVAVSPRRSGRRCRDGSARPAARVRGRPAPQGRGGGAVQSLQRDPMRAAVDVAFGQPQPAMPPWPVRRSAVTDDMLRAGVVRGRAAAARAQRLSVASSLAAAHRRVADCRFWPAVSNHAARPSAAATARHEQGFDSGKARSSTDLRGGNASPICRSSWRDATRHRRSTTVSGFCGVTPDSRAFSQAREKRRSRSSVLRLSPASRRSRSPGRRSAPARRSAVARVQCFQLGQRTLHVQPVVGLVPAIPATVICIASSDVISPPPRLSASRRRTRSIRGGAARPRRS